MENSDERYYAKYKDTMVLLSLNFDPVPFVHSSPNFTPFLDSSPRETILEPPSERYRFAKTVDNLLSQKQCDELIAFSEQFEWGIFGSTRYKKPTPRTRNVWRVLVDCPSLANTIFNLIKPYLPQTMKQCSLVGLNCRFRFLKYNDPGMHHKDHRDKFYEDPVTKNRTQITVMLYLSDECKGGETLILDPRGKSKPVAISPEVGRVLMFEHQVFHSGNRLISGVKRALRLDVLYSPPSTRPVESRSNVKFQKGRRQRNRKRRTGKSDFERFGNATRI